MQPSVHSGGGRARRLELSVIVAFFAQARELSLVLASFLEQDLDQNVYEIIVVDDHSPDYQCREVVRRARADWPAAQVRYVRNCRGDGGGYGASAKPKNIGARLARGEIVFFNNAEIVQAGQSLSYILETVRSAPGPLCLRGVVLDVAYDRILGLTPSGREALHDSTSRACERVATADHAGLAAIPREFLLRVGGNDERFDYWGKEDLDLAARLKRAGVTYRHDGRLKSFHLSHPKNHVKAGDYRRMEALLAENNSTSRIEVNVGRAWGELGRPNPEDLDAALVVELTDECSRAASSDAIEELVYGEDAERWEVVVVCAEAVRKEVEGLAERRWPQLPIVTYDVEAPGTIMARVMHHVRARRVAWVPAGFEVAKLRAAVGSATAGAAVAWASSGDGGLVGWVADRQLLPWQREWGAPRSWAERAIAQFVPPEAWRSNVALGAPLAADAASGASVRGAPLSTSASMLAVLGAARDVRITTRALRCLLSQERAPDAVCVLIPAGFPSHASLAADFPGVALYGVPDGGCSGAAVCALASACRWDTVLWTPGGVVSTRDRARLLLEEGARNGTGLLRERVMVVTKSGHAFERAADESAPLGGGLLATREALRCADDAVLRRLLAGAALARSVTGLLAEGDGDAAAPWTISMETTGRVVFHHLGGPALLDVDAAVETTQGGRFDVH